MGDKNDVLNDILKKFRCKICEKNYASNSSLWNHNNKFHNTSVKENVKVVKENVKDVKESKYRCNICNKQFSCRQSKYEHQKNVCNKINNKISIIDNKFEEFKNSILDILKSNKMHPKTFQKINKQLLNNNINNTTNNIINNNNTINNITNNTINNNITYVKFGDEKLSEILSEREMLIILNECRLSVEKSIKLTHFNDNRPELKNIIITNLQNNIGYIFNGEKFEAKPKEIILNDLFDKHLDNIENYICESDILQNKIQNNVILDKIINQRFPKFIEDLNNDKYRTDKLNELKLLTYNKSDTKVLKNKLE